MFSNIALLKSLPKTLIQRFAAFVPFLFYTGIALWIVAVARPQFGKEEFRIRTDGIAIAVCVDRSGSMAAIDFSIDGQPVNRLDAVKKTFRDFVAGRPDDLIGLLAFGGYVDAYCPLTLDHSTLVEMLNQVQLPSTIAQASGQAIDRKLLMEENATAIGDVIAQAVDRLKETQAKSKVIILLSDGEQTFGTLSPTEGAETAKAFGIKVYTIGIGSSNGESPFLVTDGLGRQQIITQPASMDEEMLQRIAALTGGAYYNAKDTQALEQVYAAFDKLEKTTYEGRRYTQFGELYRIPLVAGLILISFYIVCICTRFRRLPL
ncbi:aerotolerance regulator BatA [Planctomycetales bacterium]|nr:aerotolerance regulator BatA [Planctomycetales bacterium]